VTRLGAERYVSLATFRRDGREVRTPVWVADEDGHLVVYTHRRSGKVKRIRATGRARLAPCDARGKLRGDFVEARARVATDPVEIERGLAAVERKYGWQMWAARQTARLFGRWADRALVVLEPAAE
jgi:PPOX class probable F420-dependent enzyme